MTTSVTKSPAGSIVSSGELIFERNHDITTGTLFHEFRTVPELQVPAKTCDLKFFRTVRSFCQFISYLQ